MSGRVYEFKISSTSKFYIVKELSESTVVDVSGTRNSCFAVLNDGRVFGRGSNYKCRLGLPKETESVSTFTLIESLKKHKIISVFAGRDHSIYKTTENKMIVCGSNDNGQLFIPRQEIVYPPEEVQKCQGFTFCVSGCFLSAAFFDMDAPPIFSNQKIIEKAVVKGKISTKIKNNEEKMIKENEELKKKISFLKEENSKLETKKQIKKVEVENLELKKKIQKMKEEKLERKEHFKQNPLPILGSNEMKSYKKGKKIGRGATSEVYEVTQEIKLAMKVLDLEMLKIRKSDEPDEDEKQKEIDIEQAKKFLQESEVLNSLEDEHIIKTYGFFFGDEESPPAIILEHCESNLKKRIKILANEERISIFVDIVSAMKKVHSKGIIHRDLKLENILLDINNRAKLSDFGLCKFIKGEDETMSHTSMVGSSEIHVTGTSSRPNRLR